MTDDAFEQLWEHALASWDNEKAHGAVLELALRTENLPELAGRYRALKDDPEKGPMARRRIDAVVAAATQMLLAQKSPPPRKNPWWVTALVVTVCMVLLSLLSWSIVFRGHAPR